MWITVVRRPTLNEGGRHRAMARDPGANKGDSKRWYSRLSASLLHMANSVHTSLCFLTAHGKLSAHVSLLPDCTWQTQCSRLSASGLQRPGGQQLKLLLPCLPSN